MIDRIERERIIETARAMNACGLNQGASGNLSLRRGGGLFLTPSGVPYEGMVAEDIIAMKVDGSWHAESEGKKPSSEWRFHLDIMNSRPDVGAIVHAHPVFATALACLRKDIPAFHYMVAIAGGKEIKCSGYATFGTEELSRLALEALGPRNACLLANHGLIACGKDLEQALAIAVEVETLAAQYVRVLEIGEPVILDDEEMDRVLTKFGAGYGYASE